MLSTALRVSLAASLVLAVACGGATPPPPSTPAPSDSAAAGASAAPSAAPAPSTAAAVPATWSDDMTKPQKIAFMKQNVSPRLAKAFQAHDATKYANFDCKTCHGPDFKDPKDFLPKLTFQGGQITSKPEIAKWMHEVVAPEMASALGMQPYDPQTKKGFGCMGCHQVEMK